MWTLGVIIGLFLALCSGLAKGLSNRILFHPETLPKWMHNTFWLVHGTVDECGKFIRKPAKFNKYKDGDETKGPIFFGSTKLFIAFTNGYHLTEMLHAISLTAGSVMLSISLFFYASSAVSFVHVQSFLLLAIYVARCFGKLITYRNGKPLIKNII